MKRSPEVLSGVGDPGAASSPPPASVIWSGFYSLSGSPGLSACWEPPAEVCSSHDVDEKGGTRMGLQPSPSWGDTPWQSITPGGLEEGEMPEQGLCPHSHASQQTVKPPMMAQRRGQTHKICLSQLASLSSAHLVGSQGGRGLWLRPVCPCCWQCCDGCPPWHGHLLEPSQGGGWRLLTLRMPFKSLFLWKKKRILGAMVSLQAENSQKKKAELKKQPWP